jgi:hypothetical protein
MARSSKQTTSLWSVIENMQRRLEAEGMDRDVVDVAVTRGLEALLDIAPPTRLRAQRNESESRRRARALWNGNGSRAPAKA